MRASTRNGGNAAPEIVGPASVRNGIGMGCSLGIGLLLLAGCGAPSESGGLTLPEGAKDAASVIDEPTLSSVVSTLADDSLEGRGPATEGDRKTREYLVKYLQDLGYQPGGPDGSWEQPIQIVGVSSKMPKTWTFHNDGKSVAFSWWDEYVGTSGVQEPKVTIDDAEVVFVGYGIEAPEENWDDFKGVDVQGKVLLMLNNDPDWDPDLFAGERRLYYGRWTYKYESAARHGAAAAIIIHTEPSAGYPFSVVQGGWSGEQFELPAGDEPRVRLSAWMTEDAAKKLAQLAGQDLGVLVESARSRDFRPVPLGVRTSIRFENEVNPGARTANVLGLLPGRDPALRDEVVIYTAHHDHLGIGEPDETGDNIYNGARDNASGVATILGVAKAFAALPERPRRSILIMPVAAEEQGLLGSLYYARHPTVPPGRIMADINYDSATIFGRTHDVEIIGRGKSHLEDLLEKAAAMQGRVVVDEAFPDKGYYYRSDQFNFAKIGVPSLYFEGGTEFLGHDPQWGVAKEDEWRKTRYHRPSDEVYEDWDFSGMVEDAQLAFYVGLAVAEMDHPPGWMAGDEFEAIRTAAVADLKGD